MQQSAPSDTDLVHSLESALRMLNKRVYNPTLRQLRSTYRGLDKGSFPVLIVLQDCGQARLSELAAVLELDLSTVSRHVSHFERLGLITRTPDVDDRRAFQLSLTEEGHATVSSVRAARSGLLRSLLADWPAPDRAELSRLLTQLVGDLGELSLQPLPENRA